MTISEWGAHRTRSIKKNLAPSPQGSAKAGTQGFVRAKKSMSYTTELHYPRESNLASHICVILGKSMNLNFWAKRQDVKMLSQWYFYKGTMR